MGLTRLHILHLYLCKHALNVKSAIKKLYKLCSLKDFIVNVLRKITHPLSFEASLATRWIFVSAANTPRSIFKSSWPSEKKSEGPRCHRSIHSDYVVSIWQMSHVKWHFPFAFAPVEKEKKKQSIRQMDGWQNYCISFSFSEMEESRGQRLFTKTTWDGAAEFQALRMINGSANPVGLPAQMRTQLIAVRNTLAWMERKCRGATAKKRARLLLWTPSRLLLTRVHSVSINHGLLTAETALSHQHAIDWVTDSILTTLAPGSNEAPFFFFFKLSYHLEPHRKWKPDGWG